MIESPLQLLAIFLGLITLSVWLDKTYAWASKISAVVMILFLSALISNVGLITSRSSFYDEMAGFTVPFAVCLILFTVSLADLKSSGKPLLAAFAVACVGTIIGVIAAGLLLAGPLEQILGSDSWKLAGPFVGTYTGGSLNFFAMWNGLDVGSPDLFAAANAVDNLTIFALFAIWVAVPAWLGRFYKVSPVWGDIDAAEDAEADAKTREPELRILDVMALAFAAVTVMVLSDLIKEHLIAHWMPTFPTILIVTTLALILAQLPVIGRLQGAFQMGNMAFFLFFCAIGAMIDVKMAIVLSPVLFAYVMIMIVVHMGMIYGVGRLLRLDIRVLTIASCAAKAGPPTVVALANIHGWKNLVLPGMAMGLLGYAVGNYLGFAAAYAMKVLLGQ
ncbi:MAG: DUF819 family protein [Acidobacteriota bacterium]